MAFTKKSTPATQKVVEEKEEPLVDTKVVYSTVRPCNVLFNILCRGEVIYGHFSDKRKSIHFEVPSSLVKYFEQHHHVKSGFIVPLSKLPEKLR